MRGGTWVKQISGRSEDYQVPKRDVRGGKNKRDEQGDGKEKTVWVSHLWVSGKRKGEIIWDKKKTLKRGQGEGHKIEKKNSSAVEQHKMKTRGKNLSALGINQGGKRD